MARPAYIPPDHDPDLDSRIAAMKAQMWAQANREGTAADGFNEGSAPVHIPNAPAGPPPVRDAMQRDPAPEPTPVEMGPAVASFDPNQGGMSQQPPPAQDPNMEAAFADAQKALDANEANRQPYVPEDPRAKVVTVPQGGPPAPMSPDQLKAHDATTMEGAANYQLTMPQVQRPAGGARGGAVDPTAPYSRKVSEDEKYIQDRLLNQIESNTRAANMAQTRDEQRIAEEKAATNAAARDAQANKLADEAARDKYAQYRAKTDEYVEEAANLQVNPGRVFANMGSIGQLGVLIGGALGGVLMGSGRTNKNEFMTSLDAMIDRDIRAQEHDIAGKKWRINQRETIYEQMRKEGIDAATARTVYSEGIYKRAMNMADLKARQYDTDIARENATKLNEEIGVRLGEFNLQRDDKAKAEAMLALQNSLKASAAAHAAIEAKRKERIAIEENDLKLGMSVDMAQRHSYASVYGSKDARGRAIPLDDVRAFQKVEKTPGTVDAERLALETAVPTMKGLKVQKEIATAINTKMEGYNERDRAIAELLPLLGKLQPGDRATAEVIGQKIANLGRISEKTGVPTAGDEPYLLIHPDKIPTFDVLDAFKTKLEYALAHDKQRFREAVLDTYDPDKAVERVPR